MERGDSLLGRGTNMPRVGSWNQRVVLDRVRRARDGITRTELATSTGLSPQTISNLVRRLVGDQMIEERGTAPVTGPGKPTTMLGLRPDGLHAVGVHLDPLVITFVLLDLENQVVFRLQRPTPAGGERGQVLSVITDGVGHLLTESGVTVSRLAGVGIAVPGPVDARSGTLLGPPLMPGWHTVELRQDLHERLQFPVWLDKDVIAAAAAESWMRGPGTANFAYWYLGSGMGAGLVHHGEVLRGSSNNAGEVGHLNFAQPCACGRPDCVVSGLHPGNLVAAGARHGLVEAAAPDDQRAIDRATRELCALASAGDESATMLLNQLAHLVSRALTGVCDLLDLELVVFGGPYWSVLEPWLSQVVPDELARRQSSGRVHPLSVEGTLLGEDAGAVGAGSMVLEEAIGLRPGNLVIAPKKMRTGP